VPGCSAPLWAILALLTDSHAHFERGLAVRGQAGTEAKTLSALY